MSSTIGDYLFWRLSCLGVRTVIGRGSNTIFLGSIQRNRLNHVDCTRSHVSPASNEVGAFVASTTTGDLNACYDEGRRLFSWRAVCVIGELDSAQFGRVSDITLNLNFSAATIINSPSTAISQINRTLDVMMYESKPVYIGLSLAVAGQIISLAQTPSSAASDVSRQYASPSASAMYSDAADASVAMSFIR